MSSNEIREPIQKRSIEKKEKKLDLNLYAKKVITTQTQQKLQNLQVFPQGLFTNISEINMIFY